MDIADFSIASLVPTALVMMARIALATWLFTRGLDQRPHALVRFAAAFTTCMAAYVLAINTYATAAYAGIGGDLSQASSLGAGYLLILLVFSALIGACVGIVFLVYDVSPWVALFCGTAGYTLQNLATGLTDLLDVLETEAGIDPGAGALYWVNEWGPFLLVCAVCYLVVVRKIDAAGLKRVDDRSMLLMMPVVSLVIVGFDLVVKSMWYSDVALVYVLLLRAVHTAACVFVLWMEYELLYRRHLQQERAAAEQLLAERGRQYEQSRQSINAINLHYHAIRQELHELGAAATDRFGDSPQTGQSGQAAGSGVDPAALRELERRMCVYDAIVHTKSEALDTVLTEKGLVCEALGITLTSMADGEALGFMAAGDVYTLVGGALDAAISTVRSLDEGQRTVSLSVRRALGSASIHVECPCGPGAGESAAAGFDTRVLRETAQRYGGTFSVRAAAGTLDLDALIPEP